VGELEIAKRTYRLTYTRIVNNAALTPTEHLEASVEAADGLFEVARRGCGLQEVFDVDMGLS
jgi:hypothetical protein